MLLGLFVSLMIIRPDMSTSLANSPWFMWQESDIPVNMELMQFPMRPNDLALLWPDNELWAALVDSIQSFYCQWSNCWILQQNIRWRSFHKHPWTTSQVLCRFHKLVSKTHHHHCVQHHSLIAFLHAAPQNCGVNHSSIEILDSNDGWQICNFLRESINNG